MITRISSLIIAVVVLAGGSAPGVRAQDIRPATEYVDWTMDAPRTAAPGEAFSVRIDADIAAGWKMYAPDSPRPSFGAKFDFDGLASGLTLAGDLRQSRPIEAFDPFFETTVRYYEGEASFAQPVRIATEAAAGAHEIRAAVKFMICNDTLCLPPTEAPLVTTVQVAGEPVPADTAGAIGAIGALKDEGESAGGPPDFTGGSDAEIRTAPPSAATSDLDSARAGGLLAFVLLAIGAGLAALLTPCVFPMIPLTVSYFTRHSDTRSGSVRLAGMYGASIVVTFTALGVLTAIFIGAAGGQTIAANPWINLFIGLIFIVFALSLLGLFELRLPNGLLNYFNRQSDRKGGYLGVVFMGLTLTLVSFSCTAPFVGGLLAATAGNEWAYPVLGMLVFSATFSLPFVLFALFPNALQSLPRSGAWMNTVKVVLGFVELAAALKFLSNADLIWGWGILSRPLAIALAVVIFFLTGVYLVGKLRLSHDPPIEQIGVVRLLVAIGFFGLSLYMLPGLFGAPLNAIDAYLPPRQAGDVSLISMFDGGGASARETDLPWIEDIDAAYSEARAEDRPVFIDFTGYTCTNCRQMEANVFPQPAVSSMLRSEFVLLRLYTDDQEMGPELQRYQLRLTGTVALPTYAVVNPKDETLVARTTGLSTPSEFLAFLEEASARHRSGDALAARF